MKKEQKKSSSPSKPAAKKAMAKKTEAPKKIAKKAAPPKADALMESLLMTANLKVEFKNVNIKLSTLTATSNGINKTITQSDTIVFNNVSPGQTIKIKGSSSGSTKVEIDIDADPKKMNFPVGKINDSFFIK